MRIRTWLFSLVIVCPDAPSQTNMQLTSFFNRKISLETFLSHQVAINSSCPKDYIESNLHKKILCIFGITSTSFQEIIGYLTKPPEFNFYHP